MSQQHDPDQAVFYSTADGPQVVLDLSGDDNTSVITWAPNGGTNQKWIITPAGSNAEVSIKNVRSGTYLAPSVLPPKAGTTLVVSSQPYKWSIETVHLPSTLFRLTVTGNPNLVAVGGAQGAKVTLSNSTNQEKGNEVWEIGG